MSDLTNSKNSVHKLQFAFSTKQGKYPAYTMNIYYKTIRPSTSFGKLYVNCRCNKDVRMIDKELDPQFVLPSGNKASGSRQLQNDNTVEYHLTGSKVSVPRSSSKNMRLGSIRKHGQRSYGCLTISQQRYSGYLVEHRECCLNT